MSERLGPVWRPAPQGPQVIDIPSAGREECGATNMECQFYATGIPDELRALARWVRFDLERAATSKLRKIPRIPYTMREASNRNPAHWRPFEVAVADARRRGQCIGFVFDRTLPYVFVDLDDALGARRVLRAGAARVVDTLCTYTETSVSGDGLHVICRGALPERIQIAPDLKPIEIYPLRGPRFCVFTGDLLPVEGNLEPEIPDRTTELAALFPALPPRKSEARNGATDGPRGELSHDEIASIIAWGTPFWTDGRRHHMALYLSGYLAKKGVPRDQAVAIIAACAAGDSDPGAKVRACHDTYDDHEAGADVGGWHWLRNTCNLTDADLAPLDTILATFWHRRHPRLVVGGRLRVDRPRLRVREVAHA